MGWFSKSQPGPQNGQAQSGQIAEPAKEDVAAQDRQQQAAYAHEERMAQLKMQAEAEARAAQEARQRERRQARQQFLQGVRTWLHPQQDETAMTPLERHRARIESFEEDRETLPEKAVRYLFLALAYVLPFLVALAVGKEIGDAYSGTTDFWADGWSIGTHTVAYAGEFSLAMMVLSTAAAFRRYKADSSYTAKLLSSIFFFAVFIAASSLAQWFIAEQHIHPKNTADLAALIFRVAMPPSVDVASVLYLSIMGYKSLRKFLAEQQQKAEAIGLLNEAELKIQEAQREAERRQRETEQALALRERRENLLLRIEEIHSQAMIDTAQRALLPPGNPNHVRIEEQEMEARGAGNRSAEQRTQIEQMSAPLAAEALVEAAGEAGYYLVPKDAVPPLPGVRVVSANHNNHRNHGDVSGIYERMGGEGESETGGSPF